MSIQPGLNCFIRLNGGIRSSKHIEWLPDDKKFEILNEVDGSWQSLTTEELFDDTITHIGVAMKKGALIAY